MTYTDLQAALRVLGLGERSTLRELKARHRELVKRHHPDTGAAGDPEMIRSVNEAYRVVYDYVSAYRFHLPRMNFTSRPRRRGSGCNSPTIRCGGRND